MWRFSLCCFEYQWNCKAGKRESEKTGKRENGKARKRENEKTRKRENGKTRKRENKKGEYAKWERRKRGKCKIETSREGKMQNGNVEKR
ncbi:hypothetical protein POVWA2_039740 [Plasmodium ovale wallikeri]|uniref:Uncharacterized protein n=1 Tax=Plasmodium ovale wallikeri TaxID=864142 RepID=A0A1A8Z9B5_PLAOA|nr:hypothetical protein POVWA1_041170 [Plasmodium ovale wallikeri]SBT40451.1 hypothetical protein POVWA2_039740 [Plasmodium ovale wallikeri]